MTRSSRDDEARLLPIATSPYEHDAEKTRHPAGQAMPTRTPTRWAFVAKGLLSLMLGLSCLNLAVRAYLGCSDQDGWFRGGKDRGGPINLILMISDGYGPASHTFARSYYQAKYADDVPEFGFGLPLDPYLVGSHRSRSSNSLITDSAAGATAFSCGVKSYNGAIGVNSRGEACGTIFEAAKKLGYLTGVVVTSRLTDATPASFFAHAASRALEDSIAEQMLQSPYEGGERTIDLAIGGGGCYFLPKEDPMSCRSDDKDLLEIAQDAGWDVRLGATFDDAALLTQSSPGFHGESSNIRSQAHNTSVLYRRSLERSAAGPAASLPYLSLLTPSDTPRVIDRRNSSGLPSLADTAVQAIQLLSNGARNVKNWTSKRRRRGFMLMIEGSQIDLCQHENDPACLGPEALDYHYTAGKVIELVDTLNRMGEKTLLISTSDHETGGVALGRQLGKDYPVYQWFPDRLLKAQATAGTLSRRLIDFYSDLPNKDDDTMKQFIASQVLGSEGLGFGDEATGGAVTKEEIDSVIDCLSPTLSASGEAPPISNDVCRKAIAEVASKRALVGWSTAGHTGVDINVYAHGYGADQLHGNIENTDIGNIVAKALGLDLAALTKKLRSDKTA